MADDYNDPDMRCENWRKSGVMSPRRPTSGLDYDNSATCCNGSEIFNCRICCDGCFYVGNATRDGAVLEEYTKQHLNKKVDARLNIVDCMKPQDLQDAVSGLNVWFVGDSIMGNTFFTFAKHMTDEGAAMPTAHTTVRSPNLKWQEGGGLFILEDLVGGNGIKILRMKNITYEDYVYTNRSTYGLPISSNARYIPAPTLLSSKQVKFPLFWDLLEKQIELHNVNIIVTDTPDVHSSQHHGEIKPFVQFLMSWGRHIHEKYGCQLILTGFPIQQGQKKPATFANSQNRHWSISVLNEELQGEADCENSADCKGEPVLIEMLSLADSARHGDTTLDGTHRYEFGTVPHIYALALGMKWYKEENKIY